MNEKPDGNVTQLLLRWRAGDEAALDALLPLVYEELRALARRHLNHERDGHTLQRTALVHEAFLRIVDQTRVDFESRAQFFGLASKVMRNVLVDHARRRAAAKRGSNAVRVDLEEALQSADEDVDFEAVDAALIRLEALDPRQGKLVELRFFGGLSIEESAAVMSLSPATLKREWAVARAWLQREVTREMA